MITIVAVRKVTPDKTTKVQVIKLTGEIGGLVVCGMACLGLKQGFINRYAFGSTAGSHIGGHAKHDRLPWRCRLPHAFDVPNPCARVVFVWELRVVVHESQRECFTRRG